MIDLYALPTDFPRFENKEFFLWKKIIIFVEKNMEVEKGSAFNYIMISAAKTGIFFILFALALFYLLNYNEFTQETAFPNVKYIIFAIGLFLTLKKLNIFFYQKNIKFLTLIGWGLVFGLLFSFFDGFYYALFFQILSPDTKLMLIEQTQSLYSQISIEPAERQMALDMLNNGFIIFIVLGNMISNFFVSIIYSVIFSIFILNIKK